MTMTDLPTLPPAVAGLPRRPAPEADPLLTARRRTIVGEIRANGRQQHWTEARVVQGIQIAFNLTPLAAYRLWRWWSREEAVAYIRAVAAEEGVERVFTTVDLTEWESGYRRVPPMLLDAVCKVYRTRPDLVGYQDHTD